MPYFPPPTEPDGAGVTDHGALTGLADDDHTGYTTAAELATGVAGGVGQVVGIPFMMGGAGAVISTGVQGEIEVPFACTLTGWTMLLDQSGSIVVDIWKDTYANYPPVDADSITASDPPTISGATKGQDLAPTGWTVALAAGDILRFNVDSIATATRAELVLRAVRA